MLDKINETAQWLKNRLGDVQPTVVIILGSGLGNLRNEINADVEIPYSEIPNFPVSTVEGHAGTLISGTYGGKQVLAMNGRFHYYEGYTTKETTFPIRVYDALGVTTLLVSNAAGGMNPGFKVGDLMLITDHINMIPDHPLRGKNIGKGPRFLEMSNAYSLALLDKARAIAAKHDILLREGVYLADSGPTYETPAEYRMYRLLGADAVGMSTVPEIIVGHHCGMQCFGISVITNSGQKCALVTHDEVKVAADSAQPKMSILFRELIESL